MYIYDYLCFPMINFFLLIWTNLKNAHNSMRGATVLYSLSIVEMNPRMNDTKRLTHKTRTYSASCPVLISRDEFMLFVILSFLFLLCYCDYITKMYEGGERQEPAKVITRKQKP